MNTKEAMHKIKYWLTFYVEGIHKENIFEVIKQVENSIQRGEKIEQKLNEEISNLRDKLDEICKITDY